MIIRRDQVRYAPPGIIGFLKAFWNPCFRVLLWVRLCQRTSKWNPIGIIWRILSKVSQTRYGIQLPHAANIGKGFYIGHFGGIVVSSHAHIGKDCNISQGVTIGRINQGARKGAPYIGNRVWIGANSVLVGNIKIGNDVLIAPLSFVNFDVPNNSLVMGNPAKIIEGKSSNEYINLHS